MPQKLCHSHSFADSNENPILISQSTSLILQSSPASVLILSLSHAVRSLFDSEVWDESRHVSSRVGGWEKSFWFHPSLQATFIRQNLSTATETLSLEDLGFCKSQCYCCFLWHLQARWKAPNCWNCIFWTRCTRLPFSASFLFTLLV